MFDVTAYAERYPEMFDVTAHAERYPEMFDVTAHAERYPSHETADSETAAAFANILSTINIASKL